MARILIVDDEPGIRFGVRDFLENAGLEVEEAETIAAAERLLRESRPDAVVLDHMLPDGTALDLLPRIREIDSSLPVIVLTGHATIDLAVRAVKEGADQFLAKPVELPALLLMLQRLLESQREKRRQIAGRARQARESVDPFTGASPAIRELSEQAKRLTASSSPILIQGETGAGKGVLARWLHRNGPRGDEPFVDMNCAGLSREFLETEIFGHEKGAYTGAVTSKPGLLEVAHRGVVFLDEIGDLDPHVQPKLLKVLEEKRFRRLGEVRDRQVDVQLIAATHQDLHQLVEEKRFRSDLYFRISTIPLRVPPLRERPEDVPVLARLLLDGFAADLGRRGTRLSPAAERALAVVLVARQRARAAQRPRARAAALRPRRARAGRPSLRRPRRRARPPRVQGGGGRRRLSHARGDGAHAHRARPARAERPGGRGLSSARHPPQHALPEDQEVRPAAAAALNRAGCRRRPLPPCGRRPPVTCRDRMPAPVRILEAVPIPYRGPTRRSAKTL